MYEKYTFRNNDRGTKKKRKSTQTPKSNSQQRNFIKKEKLQHVKQ